MKSKAVRISLLAASAAYLGGSAAAQDVRFWLSFQDSAFALLNSRAIGDELRSLTSVGTLTSIQVGVMATGVVQGLYGAGGVMLVFDTVNSNGTGRYASKAAWDSATFDKVLNMASLASPNLVLTSGLPGRGSDNSNILVDVTNLGTPGYSGTAGPGSSVRSGGLWATFMFGTGKLLFLDANATVKLCTVTLTIDQARLSAQAGAAYQNFGLFSFINASTRTTYLGATTGTGQGTTINYTIQGASGTSVVQTNPDSYGVSEDGTLARVAPGVLSNDVAVPNQPLYATLVEAPAHASSFALNSDGSFNYVPAANFAGNDSFTYQAMANDGAFGNVATVSLNVQSINDPPDIVALGSLEIDEQKQAMLQFTLSDLLDNPPNAPLVATLISGPTGATLSPSGMLTWTPSEQDGPGTFNVTIKVTDSGSPALSTTKTFPITVKEVNVPPNLSNIASGNIDELALKTFTAVATDSDLPAQTITYGLKNAAPGMQIDPTTGKFQWAPTEVQGPGTYLFSVTASDGTDIKEVPVAFTVKETNVAPQIEAIPEILTQEQQLVEFTPKVTDPDLPANTIGYLLIDPPAGAQMGLFDGRFLWTPSHEQASRTFDFKIKAIDNGIPNLSDEVPVRIHVLSAGTVSAMEGKVTLQDFKASSVGEKVTFEIRNALGMLVEIIPNISLGPNGSYSITSDSVGTFSVAVKGRTWLAAARYPVTLAPTGAAKVNFSLLNGDVDGNNYVGTDDYILLSGAFDSIAGDLNYSWNADLDGDGYVGTDDYLILNKNFDQSGM